MIWLQDMYMRKSQKFEYKVREYSGRGTFTSLELFDAYEELFISPTPHVTHGSPMVLCLNDLSSGPFPKCRYAFTQ